jgi:hypothetical protein
MPHHSVIIWAGMKSIKPLPPFLPVKDSSYYILGHDAGRDFSGGNTRASMEQTDQRVRVQVKRARPISSVLRRSARLSLGCTCATLQPLSHLISALVPVHQSASPLISLLTVEVEVDEPLQLDLHYYFYDHRKA